MALQSNQKKGRTITKASIYYEPRFKWSFLHPRQFGVWVLIAIMAVCAFLPSFVKRGLSRLVGRVMFHANKKRQQIADINIKMCFPEKSATERLQMIREFNYNYAQNVIDMGMFWWRSDKWLAARTEIVGLEHYEKALSEDRPVIILAHHATGIDFAGIYLSRFHRYTTMMKTLKNPVLDWLVTRGRLRYGGRVLEREMGLRHLVRELKDGSYCYYIPDGDLGPDLSIFAPLFGVQSATIPMLGRMVKLTNAVVIPAMAKLIDGGRRYEVNILPPMDNFPTGDEYQDTLRMNQEIEKLILLAPNQYIWTLKIFQTRPDGEPDPYASVVKKKK